MKHWIASLCLALAASIAHAGTDRAFELDGALAFASAEHNQYLLAYSSAEIDSGPNIYGRVLNLDGSPSGKDFRLSRQTGAMSKPVLAYNPSAKRFLVVWGRKLYAEKRSEIYGLSIGLDGKIVGEEFRMSSSDIYDERPAIAYCPGRDRFLVTWTRTPDYDFESGVADVYGQFVSGDGTAMQGGNFPIAAEKRNQFKPDVTCDVVNDRFLVVWEDQRNRATQDDIYGQLMSSDGTMLGGNFFIAGTANVERRPVVSSNSKDGSYLVVWESATDTDSSLFGQTIASDGRMLGEPVAIGSNIGGSANRAAVAYQPQQNVFFVVWDNSGFDGLSDGIYGQFLDGDGKLRQTAFPMTTARLEQYRPHLAAASNTFLAVWTDFRDTGDQAAKRHVYEYYGRVIGNDMALSSRWRNPDSR